MQRSLLLMAFLACGTGAFAQEQDHGFKLSEAEQKMLDLTNAERAMKKLPALKASPLLFEAARNHAANMAKQAKLLHDLDDKSPYDRIKDTNYKYSIAGENIARGDVPLEEVMEAWMRSKKHRENILEKEFTEMGIGLAKSQRGDVYYSQVFAAPRK